MYKTGPKSVSPQPVTLYLHKCPTTVSDQELYSKLQTSLLLPCWLEHLMCYPSLLKPQAYLCQLQFYQLYSFKSGFFYINLDGKGYHHDIFIHEPLYFSYCFLSPIQPFPIFPSYSQLCFPISCTNCPSLLEFYFHSIPPKFSSTLLFLSSQDLTFNF